MNVTIEGGEEVTADYGTRTILIVSILYSYAKLGFSIISIVHTMSLLLTNKRELIILALSVRGDLSLNLILTRFTIIMMIFSFIFASHTELVQY